MKENEIRYYLAYGSNLNLEQMEYRCPTARKVGTALIKDYRLMFKGSAYGYYLTIEKAVGYFVPVGVFAVYEDDERSLDIYEGYPSFYYKKDFNVILKAEDGEKEVPAFAYIMHEDRPLGVPSIRYVDTVKEGYQEFGFDESLIDEAIEYSNK